MTGGRIGRHARHWTTTAGRIDLAPSRTPATVSFEAAPASITIDLARTALVIVDMQNDFCHESGWLASIDVDIAEARCPIEPLVAAVPVLRGAGVSFVWLNWGTRVDQANLPPNVIHVYDPDGTGVGIGSTVPPGAPVLERDSWGAALVDELCTVHQATDVDVHKHRMSGFWDTELDSVLRTLDASTVLFAGVNADQCVLATLIDAACIGYDTILLEDASATTSPAFCWDATIYNVRQCFGFTAELRTIAAAIAAASSPIESSESFAAVPRSGAAAARL